MIIRAFNNHFSIVEFEEQTAPHAGLRMIGKIDGHVFSYDFVLEDWAKLHHAGKFNMVISLIKENLSVEAQKRNN